jgi:hypothetical protein
MRTIEGGFKTRPYFDRLFVPPVQLIINPPYPTTLE